MTIATIVISINASWNILNFRMDLISALQAKGYRVVALAPRDGYEEALVSRGVEFFPIAIDSKGVSPVADLRLLADYRAALRRINPDLFLGYTIKPNVYGSLAAHSLGIKVINNISGLGTAFIKHGLLTQIVATLYRHALRPSSTVFFQNRDDLNLFLEKKIVRCDQAEAIPGSGIDLVRFSPADKAGQGDGCVFLCLGRLLWDKGIREYVEAARIVRTSTPSARFQLLGFLDVANRTAVSRSDVDQWTDEGLIEYIPACDDVRPHIAGADCIVLPSYREGLPRTLLEGAAMAKPLIATDVPGCRDVVEHGRTGFLCAVRDARSLAGAMLQMLGLPDRSRKAMGLAGRRKAETEFGHTIVVERYLAAVDRALASQPRR